MKMIIEKLAELEKLVDVPNVEKQPDESLKAMQMLNLIVEIRGLVKELYGEDVPEELKGTSAKLDMKRAIDSLSEGPDSKGIPEELNGTSGRYVILMERLIDMQKEMDPEWFKAHALSIVLRAYNKGMDMVFNHFEKLKANLKSERRKADEV